jgi:myo-inositol-1(or 4)-monophosphatase
MYMESLKKNLTAWTRAAGELALEKRKAPLSMSHKTPKDLVTDADLAVDTFLKEEILKSYPDHSILSEELSPEQSAETMQGPLWIVDPIDGTHNYARGHFQSAVSVAFSEGGIVQCGAVYNPFVDEFFSASKGDGAFLNGKAIRCASTNDLQKALVCVGRPADADQIDQFTRDVQTILTHCWDMRRIGSGALDICWVACGKLDAFFETLNPWDIAAAVLIAKEAGAAVAAFREREQSDLPDDLNGENIFVAASGIAIKLQRVLNP